jgi:hypothetical protein
MGEGLPFSIWRVDYHNAWVKFPQPYPATKKIGEYLSRNLTSRLRKFPCSEFD